MQALSKSKLLAYRQCPKRLWLEVHCPTLQQYSAKAQARFAEGHLVGQIARQLYAPAGGRLINIAELGVGDAITATARLLATPEPIFEAGFQARGALAFADVLLPLNASGPTQWRMIEVKSSTGVKPHQRDDAAVQHYVAREAGIAITQVVIAHIDNRWKYPGGNDYRGLLVEVDVTQESLDRHSEVEQWIVDVHAVAGKAEEPKIKMGRQCRNPYDCGFIAHCESQGPQAKYPVSWLPRLTAKAARAFIAERDIIELGRVPDALLNDAQNRVKQHTIAGTTYFNHPAIKAELAPYPLPAYFMDFETINFAVPIWAGTCAYQQIPFQFSVHHANASGALTHLAFLDLTGDDPSLAFAAALVAACGTNGPVFVYNQAFEMTRINELANRFPKLGSALREINERVVDLLPIARKHYYHPSQHGSWSLKSVLPAVVPGLDYGSLNGVKDGDGAVAAYLEAIAVGTTTNRKAEIARELEDYCALDTRALVHLWGYFVGDTTVRL